MKRTRCFQLQKLQCGLVFVVRIQQTCIEKAALVPGGVSSAMLSPGTGSGCPRVFTQRFRNESDSGQPPRGERVQTNAQSDMCQISQSPSEGFSSYTGGMVNSHRDGPLERGLVAHVTQRVSMRLTDAVSVRHGSAMIEVSDI